MSDGFEFPSRLSHYELIEEIGRGPYCVVWRASSVRFSQQVALKILDPRYAGDENRVARFSREASLASTLDHPNIVRVNEVVTKSTETPLPFFSMDLLAGGSLSQFRGASTERYDMLIELLVKVCAPLEYIHRLGLVHCDVKASNVLLDDQRTPFLADFGMAASPEYIAESGSHGGTIVYMSPEQFESLSRTTAVGVTVDGRSDIYSLGVLMYSVFTGEMPYKGSNRFAIMYQRLRSDPTPPRQLCSQIPKSIEEIILRAMARDPDKRFPSISALADALADALRQS